MPQEGSMVSLSPSWLRRQTQVLQCADHPGACKSGKVMLQTSCEAQASTALLPVHALALLACSNAQTRLYERAHACAHNHCTKMRTRRARLQQARGGSSSNSTAACTQTGVRSGTGWAAANTLRLDGQQPSDGGAVGRQQQQQQEQQKQRQQQQLRQQKQHPQLHQQLHQQQQCLEPHPSHPHQTQPLHQQHQHQHQHQLHTCTLQQQQQQQQQQQENQQQCNHALVQQDVLRTQTTDPPTVAPVVPQVRVRHEFTRIWNR